VSTNKEEILRLRSNLSTAKRTLLEKRLRGEVKSDSIANVIPRRSSTALPPLSFSQQRLWFLQQLEPDNPFYNEHLAIQLTGSLDIAALEQSINKIIQRHEALRTTFEMVEGQPIQIIVPNLKVTLSVVDLCELPEAEQNPEIQRLATEEIQRPFNLVQGPLLRWTLLKLDKQKYVLLLVIHHIVGDGWSGGVFIRELSTLYQAFSTGKPASLSELPIQYADFAVWQRQELQGEKLESQLLYWKQQLANAPPLLQLPTDRPRPTVQTYRGTRQSFLLPKSLTEALKAITQKAEATLFMSLLAAFKILLYRYTEVEDLIVGSPIANRNRAEIEGLIGCFINTLVLRTTLSGDPTFEELLGRVQKVMMGAYTYQDLPFEKLVEELRPERDANYNPLFQVSFALQNTPKANFELPGLTITPFEVESTRALFDLHLNITETDAGLECFWEYNTDLLETDTISRLSKHFQTLLEGIIANLQQPISQLPLLSEAEQQKFLQWNQTQAEYPHEKCLHQLFEEQVERTPNAVAVEFEDRQLTYGQLNQQANQLAHHLQNLGVKPEVLVGICLKRSLEMVIGLLAILKAGGAYVPLDPDYPPQRLALMLSDSQAPVLLTQQGLLNRLPDYQGHVLCIDRDREVISQENPPSSTRPDNLAYLIYTSGSTGLPKGVQIPHSALVNFLKSMEQQPGLTASDTLLAVTSISFDIAALELYLPLITGARLVLVSRELASDGKQLIEQLTTSGATVMQATPATWRMLLVAGWQGNPQLKILCGGEALATDLAEQLLTKGNALWNLYGPTETTIWSAIYQVEESKVAQTSVPIGHPIANTQIYLLDSFTQPVPVGVPGELHIAGDGLARGYLHRPELTAQKFITSSSGERLYKTGDLARYLADGTIEYLGRIDHQVKLRGFRIELGEIETVLRQHLAVEQAVVIAREDEPGNKRLVAYLVGQVSQGEITGELRNFLAEKLPKYMIPSAFVLLEALPLTPNGKIDRPALATPETVQDVLETAFVAPRSSVEEVLAGIWAEVLGIKQVSIYDNFFELGGHSLLATQVVSRTEKTFQLELPLRHLFESPTVVELATVIEETKKVEPPPKAPPIKPVPRNGKLPLSFAQQRLWFLQQLEPDSFAYNISAAIRLIGSLNIAVLLGSLNEIVRRHEALRTTFDMVEGQIVQVIAPTLEVKLPVVDLGDLPEAQRDGEILRLAKEEAQRPFNLAQGPLMRGTLLQISETEHVWLFTMHHIVSDGWSIGVLIRELATLYEAFSAGQSSPLPPLSIQYADFAVWQREWLQGEVLDNQLAYWRQQLGTNLPVLKLPTDYPRDSVPTSRGATYSFQLPSDLSKALQELSRREGVTLFMTLLAGFQVLLQRYTNQDDIVVGTDVANRNRAETEPLIGFFINLLVLRTDLSGNPSFRELLPRVREVALGAYAHQDLPFEKLVEALQPERQSSHTPLFQVLFVLQNAPMPPLELPGLTLNLLEIENETTKFDLGLFLTEAEQGIEGYWQYKADLFESSTIKRMSAHWETLLQSIVTQPDTPINNLEMLTDTEKEQQIAKKKQQKASKLKKFRSVQPKAVELANDRLVKTDCLKPGAILPCVITPNVDNLNIIEWAKTNRDFIETELLNSGAILFRNFGVNAVEYFESFAEAICPGLFGEYGDLPRQGVSGKVYGSTPYPHDQAILFHNESSHLHCWPQKIWFFCVQPAQQGGETPIIDCRKVLELLDLKLHERFEQKQLMYIRNYTDGLDVSWQDFFHTTDKKAVENYCRQAQIDFEWLPNNGLRTRKVRPAITKHPKTGEQVFFNQLQLHHISCLEAEVRDSLLSMFGEENLPRNVYYGDGSPIEDSVMTEIEAIYQEAKVSFPWQQGDVLMLDNMLTAHARNPYVGSRKIVVAMGEMIHSENAEVNR